MAVAGLFVAIIFKVLEIIGVGYGIPVILYILANEFWFVIGMCVSVWDVKRHLSRKKKIVAITAGIIFVGLRVLIYKENMQNELIGFVMGLIACYSVVVLVMSAFDTGR